MIAPFPPTPRQMEALRFIAGHLEAHGGISPTLAQIRGSLGFASKSSVVRVLDALEERGHIRRLRGRHQAIEVLAAVTVPRAPGGAPLFFVPAEQIRAQGPERAAA